MRGTGAAVLLSALVACLPPHGQAEAADPASAASGPAAGSGPAASGPAASGPTMAVARGVEFQRFDPETGMLSLCVSADRASASGELAELTRARLTRYDPSGRVVLEARADTGRMGRASGVTLEGNVRVRWQGAVALARFRAPSVGWDGKEGVLSTREPVSGTLEGLPSGGSKSADGEAWHLELEGLGLVVSPGRDRGEIVSDAVVVVGGTASGPWRATADGGLVIEGLAGERPVVRLRGPVGVKARGISARSDAVELHLRRSSKGAGGGTRAGSDPEGKLELARAWATGQVHASIERASAPVGPGGPGRVEVRAGAAELFPVKGGAVLTGTISDPARVIFPSGVVRGTRVELFPEGVTSDGGARTEFVVEGPSDGRRPDSRGGPASTREPSRGPPLRIECEGPVRWSVSGDGSRVLRLSGGVLSRRGDVVMRSLRAEVVFSRGAEALELVRAEGRVDVTSPQFSARADVAELRRADPPERPSAAARAGGGGVPAHSFRITLERRERAEVELRAGKVLVACMGPVVYDTSSRVADLSGGVRARAPGVRMRSEEASVHFRQVEPKGKPPPAARKPGEEGKPPDRGAPGEASPELLPGIERIELRGGVVADSVPPGSSSKATRPGDGGGAETLPRRIRASRATYDAARAVVVFRGDPEVEVRYRGWVLTDREITLHVRDNRIESSSGKLRATKGPER